MSLHLSKGRKWVPGEEHYRQEKDKCKDPQWDLVQDTQGQCCCSTMIKAGMLGDEFTKVPGSHITYTLADWCEGFSLGEVTGRFWVERESLTFKKRKGYSAAMFSEVKSLSCVQLFAIPWTVACQAPPSMGFSRQEYWSGLPFPSPGDLPNPGIEPGSPTLQADSLLSQPPGKLCWEETVKGHEQKQEDQFKGC